MNPIVFALRHPITMIMLVVALVGGGALALNRMRIDIFPPINQPPIYVFVNYGGYDPFQMEGLLVSPFELWFQFVDGVRSMESKSIQQVAVVKLSFYPDTDMSKAMAQVVSVASRAQATQPDGTLPPLIMQMDAGNVPVGYLVFQQQDPLARRDRRPGPVPSPALAPDLRPRHRLDRAVRLVHPRHHRQRRSRQAAHLQPHAPGRGQRRQRGQRHQPLGQPLRPGRHAARPQQRHGSRAEELRQHPAQARPQRLPARRGARSPTPPTSTTATPWWTAASRSTCRSSRRTPPRRSRWCPTSTRRCRSSRACCRRTWTSASRSTNRRPWSRP